MTKIIVNYDPFAKESQILTTDENGTTGTTYSDSELSRLAETVALRASELDQEETKIYIHAPEIFYNKLTSLVQAHYALNNKITMERI